MIYQTFGRLVLYLSKSTLNFFDKACMAADCLDHMLLHLNSRFGFENLPIKRLLKLSPKSIITDTMDSFQKVVVELVADFEKVKHQ